MYVIIIKNILINEIRCEMSKFTSENTSNLIGPKIMLSLLMTLIFFLSYASNLFGYADLSLQDMFFQAEKEVSEEIVIIGVTADDLSEFGMWPWDRTTWANVLSTINSDEQTKPAAIGLSVPFYGSSQPLSDELLTSEISKDNVVISCAAEFTTDITSSTSSFAEKTQIQVASVSYPYIYPNENIRLGHTNIIFDSDGILRHGLLNITTDQGATINSIAYETFQVYCDFYGIENAFEPKLDENGFWYVDYSTSSDAYFDYSVTDIIKGNFNQQDLAGKMVLIGVYDTALMDYYRPSIDHSANIYGVEFMANCINAMINDSEIAHVKTIVEVIVLLISTFIITFVSLYFSFAMVTMLALVTLISGLVIIHICYQNGIMYPPFYFVVGLFTCYILAVGFNYWFEWYSKKHVTQIFSQYVDPKVMQELIHSNIAGLHTAGVSRDIAVLFVDLRGFTSFSEKLEPETVVNILSSFLTLTDNCIRQFDGTLDKFIGDCTMAFWGAPGECDDPCYPGLLCSC